MILVTGNNLKRFMRKLSGFLIIEVLCSLSFFYIVMLLFMQTNKNLQVLGQYSKDINSAVILIKEKHINCIDKMNDIKYGSNNNILYGRNSYFLWVCKVNKINKNFFELEMNNFISEKIVESYERDIYLSIYSIINQIMYNNIRRVDISILWQKNNIKLKSYIRVKR